VVPASNAELNITLKVGGSYASANYKYNIQLAADSSSSAPGIANSQSASSIPVLSGQNINTTGVADLVIHVFNPASASLPKKITLSGPIYTGSNLYHVSGSAMNTSTSALTGVKLAMSSGNITSGKARLYGIKNS
jgi:hypothetical protein